MEGNLDLKNIGRCTFIVNISEVYEYQLYKYVVILQNNKIEESSGFTILY